MVSKKQIFEFYVIYKTEKRKNKEEAIKFDEWFKLNQDAFKSCRGDVMSIQEISSILGINESEVKHILSSTMSKLKRMKIRGCYVNNENILSRSRYDVWRYKIRGTSLFGFIL